MTGGSCGVSLLHVMTGQCAASAGMVGVLHLHIRNLAELSLSLRVYLKPRTEKSVLSACLSSGIQETEPSGIGLISRENGSCGELPPTASQ